MPKKPSFGSTELNRTTLDKRVAQRLMRRGIRQVHDLRSLTWSEIAEIPNIGPTSIANLRAFCKEKRIWLRSQPKGQDTP